MTSPITDWYCHCCSAKNISDAIKCRVCGRPENYVLKGHHLPLHGSGSLVYRPSHIEKVLYNIHEADAFEWQSLHVAAYSGNIHLVKSLLLAEADINAVTLHGHTPLYLAVQSDSIDCVELLLRSGASSNMVSLTEKISPLHVASGLGNLTIVQLLLRENSTSINNVDIMGRTALHHAAKGGHTAVGNYLIQRGINYLQTDAHGWSARQTAEYNGFRKFEEAIVRAGLTVQQAVIKDLPPAEWQCSLWSKIKEQKRSKELDKSQFLRLLDK